MQNNIQLNLKHANILEQNVMQYADKVASIHDELHEKSNDEKEFLGWLELPSNYNKKEFENIKKAAQKIRKDSEVFVVIGIGGSYLGARAVIEALNHTFYNLLSKEQRKTPQILYVGNNLSPNYINDLIELIGNRDVSINVISKSGTTTEPAIAFRIFRELLENKYGLKEARKRIYVTTDKEKGALKQIANEEKYTTLIIPNNVGGRYSVLTAVGLLPIAVAGIDIDELIEGARFAQGKYLDKNLKYNACYQYAVARNMLYQEEKNIEILVSYEPRLHYIIEWWKQLFGESEGKEQKGIYPTGAEFTTDLHSLGQYIQEGRRNLFETVIDIKESETDIQLNRDEDNLDELNYLEGKGLDYVNKKAMEGTIEAHEEGGVPNIVITMDKLNTYNLGHLIYFFELGCAMSGKLLGVNPFNQPGVEKYKQNMFRLLGKPGYTETKKEIRTEVEKTSKKGQEEKEVKQAKKRGRPKKEA
ncbi:MAG: glucose-6-phosphate isomerase [Clostridia bacterium]|nr:glucose-6-phosphate isomerase [Clostridia bacterium]